MHVSGFGSAEQVDFDAGGRINRSASIRKTFEAVTAEKLGGVFADICSRLIYGPPLLIISAQ